MIVPSMEIGMMHEATPLRPSEILVGGLSNGEFGMRPHVRRMESEDNAIFRDAGFDQADGNAFLGAIALDPDFAVDDVEVNEDTMNASRALPSLRHYEIPVVFRVKHSLIDNVAKRVPSTCVFA